VALAEVLAGPAAKGDLPLVHEIEEAIKALPHVEIVDFDRRHAVTAALIRGRTNLKLPDCAILATAYLSNSLAIIGNDKQWRNKQFDVPYVHLDDVLFNEPEAV
jgi:PIN domain nuclease of toxin-antitoxin system